MAVTIGPVSKQKAGQTAAQNADFERLFQEHWERLNQVLQRLVVDPAEAQDLALEAFWRLYSNQSRQGDNVGGWLYRVALRLGYNALRAESRRGRYELEAGKISLEEHVADPASQAIHAEQQRRVRWVLATMKPRQAQIIMLRYSGFSYAEIAAALGVPVTSVGTLLVRAEKEFEKRFPLDEV
jgi:RNA polymerase sigma-70 factor (ECF subfamily)